MRLIEKVWFHQHAAKWLLVPLLLPLSLLFYLLSALRRFSFKCGLAKSYTLTKPVIVVGNIGVGGNGKTPVVIFLVELTRRLGLKPGVISRGYGGQAPHYPYLLDDSSTAREAGDEPVLIKERCQVAVAVGSDRIASANLLITQGCNIIISDDGLQHYRLHRELELIVVDSKRLFGNGLLLPAGPLREGKWRLFKSDLLIFNGTRKSHDNIMQGTKPSKKLNVTPSLTMTLVATKVCNLLTGESIALKDFVKSYPKINAIAGIGDPQRFFDTLLINKFTINKQQAFVDHHSFSLGDFNTFDGTIPLLMTEKDAVKCRAFSQKNWWYLPVEATFNSNEQQIITDKIKAAI